MASVGPSKRPEPTVPRESRIKKIMGMKSCPNQLGCSRSASEVQIARKNGASVLLARGLIFNCQAASERSHKNFKGFDLQMTYSRRWSV